MLSFSNVVSFHQKQRQLCETMPYVEQTWALNRILDSKMMELILMALNIKVLQNMLRIKITYNWIHLKLPIFAFFQICQIINHQIMFLFDQFRTDSKFGEFGLNHTRWSPRLVKLVKLVKVVGLFSWWTSSWTVKSLEESWKTSKTILNYFSSSCNFIQTNARTSKCGNSSRIPPPAQLLLHFSDFYPINFHSYIPGMKLRAQVMSSAWVCLLVSISFTIPII